MLGAIYIGLSGMDAYSKGLQVISNNVANLNTPGFKASKVQFSDLFDEGGSGGLTYLGSNFSSRSGGGVQLGNSLLDFGQGDLQQTDNNLDLSLQGSGFLTLLTKDGDIFYTRTGSFAVDADGFVSEQSTGYRLAVLDSGGRPTAVNVDTKHTSPPVATTKIAFSDNLAADGTTASVSNLKVFDSAGTQHTWDVEFAKATGAGLTDTWDVTVKDESGATIGTSTLKFGGSSIDPTTTTFTVSTSPTGAEPLSVVMDFSNGVTSFSAGTSSTISAEADGHAEGDLTSVTVDETGHVLLTYSNSQTSQEGAIAVADFRSPQDLKQLSQGLFSYDGSSELHYRASAENGVGTIETKQLEASNVDLSSEFGNLILIQRGFQACSQVVSVANDMIQQLFGMRGQG